VDKGMEKLVEKIVAEVIKELSLKGVQIVLSNEQINNACSCSFEKINPCCRTSELSKKYLISIKAEVNDCMAL
jgi:hypothetical protein